MHRAAGEIVYSLKRPWWPKRKVILYRSWMIVNFIVNLDLEMFIVWSFNLDFEDDTNKRDTVKNKDKRSYKFASTNCKISKFSLGLLG